MKKLIALLLVVVMAMSAIVTVAAEGTQQATSSAIEAPVYVGAQVKAGTGFSAGTYSVRFVSTVKSTAGKCIGYEITATYETNSKDVYSGEETEGVTVYSSIMSGNVPVTASQLTDGAVGIYVMAITGVPAEEHVIFNVTAYIKYDEGGEEKVLKSTAKYERYDNGEVMPLVSAYTQDFETVTSLEAAGITKAYGGLSGEPLAIIDDITGRKLTFDTTNNPDTATDEGWNNSRWLLVSNDVFKYAPAVYAIEMDLTFTKMNVFNFILNGGSGGTDATADRKSSVVPSVRYSANGSTFGEYAVDTTRDVYVGTGYFDASGGQKNPSSYEVAYDPKGSSASFKYTVIVDSSYEDGCKIDYYIDDVYLTSHVQTGDAYDVTANSALILWAQQCVGTMDNIKVSVLAQETVYFEDFDTAATAADAGVTTLYNCAKDLSLSNGTLFVHNQGWVNGTTGGSVNWNLTPTTAINSSMKKYLVEMDIVDLEHLGPLTFYLNSEGVSAPADRANGMSVSLRLANGMADSNITNNATIAGSVTQGYDIYARAAINGTSGSLYLDDRDVAIDLPDSGETALEKISFRLGILVDSSVENGTTISVFIDGEFIVSYEYTGDDNRDVDDNCSVIMNAQNTKMYIDNLRISQLYK